MSSIGGGSWAMNHLGGLAADAASVRGEEPGEGVLLDRDGAESSSASMNGTREDALARKMRIQRFVPAVALARGPSGWTTNGRVAELWGFILSKLMHNLGGYLRPESWEAIYQCTAELEKISNHEGERRLIEMHGETPSMLALLHATCCIVHARHWNVERAIVYGVRAATLIARESAHNALVTPAGAFLYRHVCVFLRQREADGWIIPAPQQLWVDASDKTKGFDATAFPAMRFYAPSSASLPDASRSKDDSLWYETPLFVSSMYSARVWPMAARMLSGLVQEYDARGWTVPAFLLETRAASTPCTKSSSLLAPVRAVLHAADESADSLRAAAICDLIAGADGQVRDADSTSPLDASSRANYAQTGARRRRRVAALVHLAPPIAARVGIRLPWAPHIDTFVYPGAGMLKRLVVQSLAKNGSSRNAPSKGAKHAADRTDLAPLEGIKVQAAKAREAQAAAASAF